MQIPNHITDLTRADFAEIAKAANLDVGPGLVIDMGGNGLVIQIDTTWLKNYVQAVTTADSGT